MSKQSAQSRRQEREKERQRRRQQTIIVAIIAVAVVIFGLVLVSNLPAEAPIPEDLGAAYAEIPQGRNDDGFPRLGAADAPVALVEYSSFSCPACASFHDEIFPQLLDRIRSGQVSFTFIPLLTGSVSNPEGAARASLCALEQGKFWEAHDLLFSWHEQFANTAFSSQRLSSAAEGLGLNTQSFNNCFSSGNTSNLITLAQQRATRDSVPGTPTLYVNGTRVNNALDSGQVFEQIDLAFAPFADRFNATPSVETPEPAAPTPEPEAEATLEAEEVVEEATTEPISDAEDTPEAPEAEATAEATAESG